MHAARRDLERKYSVAVARNALLEEVCTNANSLSLLSSIMCIDRAQELAEKRARQGALDRRAAGPLSTILLLLCACAVGAFLLPATFPSVERVLQDNGLVGSGA